MEYGSLGQGDGFLIKQKGFETVLLLLWVTKLPHGHDASVAICKEPETRAPWITSSREGQRICPVLVKMLPGLALSSPRLPLLQSQSKPVPVPSNGAGKAAAPTQPGLDAPLTRACLGYALWFISSTAAEKMFQGVRKFPELELVKLMY